MCDGPMYFQSQMCRACRARNPRKMTDPERAAMSARMKGVPKSAAHRAAMSAARKGKPKPEGWVAPSKRPEVAAKIAAYWTPEVRAAKAAAVSNPNARYHMLSARKAAAIVRKAGECHRCGHDGSESRLGIHHRDRNKHNQAPNNLEVLCHRCHMREHSDHQEVGWARFHAKA